MIELFKNPWDEEAIIILTNFFRIAFIFNEVYHHLTFFNHEIGFEYL
jgi:hypothetical protein